MISTYRGMEFYNRQQIKGYAVTFAPSLSRRNKCYIPNVIVIVDMRTSSQL
jgi:hypothetical protein